MSGSLTDYIKLLKKNNQLAVINAETDPVYEIGEIAARTVASGGPALLFKNVKGSKYPLFMNGFGTAERAALSLGFRSMDELERKSSVLSGTELFNSSSPFSAALGAMKLSPFFPSVTSEPAGLIAEKPNFSCLPALKTYPEDGGRFITTGITVLKDPETGRQNYGLYRLQIYDDGRLGLHFHNGKDAVRIFEKWRAAGGRMPVAVAVGCDPCLLYAASAPLPDFIDEMRFAGLVRGFPVSLRRCRTCELLVPSYSEFVFEGYCDTVEKRLEGPFGDHTGYYSATAEYPVFTPVLTVRRKNPVFTATVTGKPLKEDYFMGLATERLFLPVLKLMCPEICNLHFFPEGVFHGCVAVSVKNSFAGAVGKIFHFIWGNGQLKNSKFIIAVDADVDVFNRTEVLWRLFNNVDFERDITVDRGTLDDLDSSSPSDITFLPGKIGGRIGIDATSKRCGTAQITAKVPERIKKKVTERWNEYGIR